MLDKVQILPGVILPPENGLPNYFHGLIPVVPLSCALLFLVCKVHMFAKYWCRFWRNVPIQKSIFCIGHTLFPKIWHVPNYTVKPCEHNYGKAISITAQRIPIDFTRV